ncbi:actin nucleation-promoting factor WAS-like [Dryobates pubescens]|uniref:actin nucleation-promoting factor WAS-like n=1 Tax=Dryobates pubescens TaxID=118200 RepID=UPI0023B95EF8|nr:actin nucleation-promoting factor WAS-like [Dryobates pubescens]
MLFGGGGSDADLRGGSGDPPREEPGGVPAPLRRPTRRWSGVCLGGRQPVASRLGRGAAMGTPSAAARLPAPSGMSCPGPAAPVCPPPGPPRPPLPCTEGQLPARPRRFNTGSRQTQGNLSTIRNHSVRNCCITWKWIRTIKSPGGCDKGSLQLDTRVTT